MNKIEILGVKFDSVTKLQALKKIEQFLDSNEIHHVVTPNPEFLVFANKNKSFQTILNKADLSLADGAGIILASRYLHHPLPAKITGTDFVPELAHLASKRGERIFFLGGQLGAAELVKDIFENQNTGIKIVGALSGPTWKEEKDLKDDEFITIIQQIKDSRASILIVAFGAPKQEIFINHFRDKLGVKVAIGVGGAFDYIAGLVPRAPAWIRNLGLEWLHRLITQPKRWRRIFNAVIVFPLLVLFKNKSYS